MKTTIYHNPRCRKSREGLAIVEANTSDIEVIEYLKEPLTAVQLSNIISKLGIQPEALIRKGEADYKAHFKGKDLTDQEWINAMVQYPKLIERPIVVKGSQAVIGRPPENINTLF